MKLFGYSISLNVLILMGLLYLIMVVNALSASCNMEGLMYSSDAIRKELRTIKLQARKSRLGDGKGGHRPLDPRVKSRFKNDCLKWLANTNDPTMIKEINDAADEISKM